MGLFEALMFIASLGVAAYSASQANGNGMPELPGYMPPDYEPLQEQSNFIKYQDKTRNKLLNQFYGGKMHSGRPIFKGDKPAEQYRQEQDRLVSESQSGFSGDLERYFAERGIESGDQVAGAGAKLAKDYEQRSREINAKSHDIYAMTLGNLFGEVSDAGGQAAQLAGSIGQANQMENARRDQSYQQAMQKWQYDQNQPNAWSSVGSLLPILGMMGSAYSSNQTPYYGTAQTYQPGNTYNWQQTHGPSNTFNLG